MANHVLKTIETAAGGVIVCLLSTRGHHKKSSPSPVSSRVQGSPPVLPHPGARVGVVVEQAADQLVVPLLHCKVQGCSAWVEENIDNTVHFFLQNIHFKKPTL